MDWLGVSWLGPFILASGGEDGFDLVEAPGEVVAADDEGRSEADDGVVGFLAEDAAVFEGFAEGACGDVELDADPEAFAADVDDPV